MPRARGTGRRARLVHRSAAGMERPHRLRHRLAPVPGGLAHPACRGDRGREGRADVVPAHLDRPRHPRRPRPAVRDRSEGDGAGLRPPDLPPVRGHRQRRPRAARRPDRGRGPTKGGVRRPTPHRADHTGEPVGDRGVRRDRRVDPLHRGPQAPRGHHRTRRAPHDTGAGAGLHGPRLRAGTHEGHGAGTGTVPSRICLRVAAKSHVGMVLGDQAYDRGAWANRIGESEPGVGYLFGEGIREPLRVRGGWVPDDTIKELETFVTGGVPGEPASIHPLRTIQRAAPRGAA